MAESILICRHNKNGTGYCECLGEYCVEGPCTAEELIEYAPVRHGRWEWYDLTISFHYINRGYRCSVCGHKEDDEPNYCPNCGAKMDKEE